MFAASSFEIAIRQLPHYARNLPEPRAYVGDFANRQSRNFLSDPLTGWRMRPDTKFHWIIDGNSDAYVANKQGFRSSFDFNPPRPGGTIALLGDSFAFGTGVDLRETFGFLLQQRIGGNMAVYNLAMPGFGVDQMWMGVRHQALALKPALIVVAFVDIDLDRSLTAYRSGEGFNKPVFELDEGALRPQRPGDKPHPVARYLERNSVLWNMGRLTMRELGIRFGIGGWWRRNKAILAAIKADAEKSGVPLVMVRLPMKQAREFPALDEFARTSGLAFIDMGSPGGRPARPIHFKTDDHINEAGHRFVFNRLRDWIEKKRLFSQPR